MTDAGTEEAAGNEDPAADEAEDASVKEDAPAIRYQDTVDLTPLPGFDEASEAARGEESAEPDGYAESDEGTGAAKPARKSSRPKSKRASMPSWDEIVFGSKHD